VSESPANTDGKLAENSFAADLAVVSDKSGFLVAYVCVSRLNAGNVSKPTCEVDGQVTEAIKRLQQVEHLAA
jgi:hypothetical protein